MKIVRPQPVTDLNLTTSNVTSPETSAPIYVGATVYALGDRVTHGVASSAVTITNADPAVITWAAHEIPVGGLVYFTTTGTLPSGIAATNQYYVKSVTTNTFTIASFTYLEDTAIRTSSAGSGTHTCYYHNHKTYVSLQAANSGHSPRLAASAAYWLEEGASNRWKMFDGSVSSQSVGSTISVKVAYVTAYIPDTLALFNIRGSSCVVKIWDSAAGAYVYNQTHSLVISGVTPQETYTDLLLTNLPATTSSAGWIEVVLSDYVSSKICAIGAFILGTAVDAGGTEYGASTGIQDFSVIEADTFGNYSITERAFSKTASFQVMVPLADVPRVYRLLSEQRAKKCLYIGSDSYTSTAIYGFPSDWSMVIQYPNYSVLNIDIKGMV